MRIAFLTYSMTGGGAERVIAETANYFSRVYKDEVWILELSDTDSAYPLNPEIHLVRMKIARESRNVLDSVGNFLSYQKTIRRFVREQQIEVLISSSVKHGVTVKLGMPWLKVIGSEHSNPYMAARGRGERVTRFLSPVMDGCIFLTQGAKQYYPAALGKKSRVIHNAVYLDSHALKPLQNGITIIYLQL
ncbi:MAG: glycosyltransferase [Oscillospiraceae bacterium]|nr:glycosyltransferase [Oscillospiraceae bacterium]